MSLKPHVPKKKKSSRDPVTSEQEENFWDGSMWGFKEGVVGPLLARWYVDGIYPREASLLHHLARWQLKQDRVWRYMRPDGG